MSKLELIEQILMVISDFDEAVDIDSIAAGLEDHHPNLESILDKMEKDGLVERLQVLGAMDAFLLTKKGRRKHEGQQLRVTSIEGDLEYQRWLERRRQRRQKADSE